MRATWLVFLTVWFVCAPQRMRADGCFIAPTAFARVQIPDQRALIHYADGSETLVIDSSLEGNGTNFAWIIPVPSAPKVEAATTGLFPTLDLLFQPRVIHSVTPWWIIAPVCAIVLFLIVRGFRTGEFGGLVLLLILLLLSSMLLPALGTAGISISHVRGEVDILERKTVGVFDTAVLKSSDGKAVIQWLDENGFVAPPDIRPMIEKYCQEGWYFVASKMRRDTPESAAFRAHPLTMKFKTDRPVYPVRLTGIGNKPCRIDLYVFGPDEAASPLFKVVRCGQPEYPGPGGKMYRSASFSIIHPLLRELVDRSPVATKLTALLTPQSMASDAYISWQPYTEKQETFYSSNGAWAVAANVAAIIFCAAASVCYLIVYKSTETARKVRRTCVWGCMIGLISWLPIRLVLPVVPVSIVRRPEWIARSIHSVFSREISNELQQVDDEFGTNNADRLLWLHRELEFGSQTRGDLGPAANTNAYTGQPWREEDSPGNAIIRETPRGIDYVWFDGAGAEHPEKIYTRTNTP